MMFETGTAVENFIFICLILLALRDLFMWIIWNTDNLINVFIKITFIASTFISVIFILKMCGLLPIK